MTIRGDGIEYPLIVGCHDNLIHTCCFTGLFNCVEYQGLVGYRQEHLTRQPRRRIPGRNDRKNWLLGICPVCLHGILDYIGSKAEARMKNRNLLLYEQTYTLAK